ncbi:MAG: hypothetical protein H0U74_10330 [Bradymonadaceae bacterium]|nr:hypothetical protein [Lujinxingiaceae bacterium]
MNRLFRQTALPALLASSLLFSASAAAQTYSTSNPDNVPNVTVIMGGTVASNNNGLKQGAAGFTNSWTPGACPVGTSYQYCDDLRFGLSLFPKRGASDTDCLPSSHQFFAAKEDGGADVVAFFDSPTAATYTQHYCHVASSHPYRPLDSALTNQNALSFPGGAGATLETKTKWFKRPNLALVILDALPQTSNTILDRVKTSLKAACDNRTGIAGHVPPMPTWVILARDNTSSVKPFTGLLSAAGGTGECCDKNGAGGTNCVPTTPAHRLDVCAHIETRTEAELRSDMAAARYRCNGGDALFSTGAMDYGDATNASNGAALGLSCHLGAVNPGNQENNSCTNNGRTPTDVLGIFACIRQAPLGTDPTNMTVAFCDNDGLNCIELTDGNGIDFIDPPNNTMFMISEPYCGKIRKGDGEAIVTLCKNAGKACNNVLGGRGRCAQGVIACHLNGDEYCKQTLFPMPEICNGLDNDCEGQVDNLSSTTVTGLPAIPASKKHLNCRNRDACVCPDGPEDEHADADNLTSYLAAHTGKCHCETALFDDEFALGSDGNHGDENQAACAASSTSNNASGLGLFALGLLLLGAGRRARRR